MQPSREAFETLWSTLHVDATQASGAMNATLRADALALDRGVAATGELPRISLRWPPGGEPGAGATPAESGADIALRELLGEGGMGKIYLARQSSLGRDVAVKVVRDEAHSAGMSAALLHEARVTGALEHPNVVPVHALGLDATGRPLMVMKRVEGTCWRDLLRDPAHPAWERLPVRHDDPLVTHVEVLIQVCNALQYAHARGVVHRDIKPENVMVGEFGEVYLLDWGIAVALEAARRDADGTRHVVGTPSYLAPEMIEGRVARVAETTDVYLLGATLHEVLTGAPRHAGATLHEVLLSAWESAPIAYPSAAPSELAALCNDATSHDPEKRPTSAAAFRLRLVDYLRHRASLALSDSASASMAKVRALDGRDGAAAGHDMWRFLTECRFGYLQALREWSGNAAARAGLRNVLVRMIELEIARRSPSSARGLLGELPDPPGELRARVLALEEEMEALHARGERLETIEREMDLDPSRRARAWGLFAFLVLVGGTMALLETRHARAEDMTMRDGLRVELAISGALLAGAYAARKRLFSNAIARRVSVIVLGCVALTNFSDGLETFSGGTVESALRINLRLIAAVTGTLAVASIPAMGWIAGVALVGATLTAALPAYAREIAQTSMLCVLVTAIVLAATGRMRTHEGAVLARARPPRPRE
jgi:serine/threonine-protein kinase